MGTDSRVPPFNNKLPEVCVYSDLKSRGGRQSMIKTSVTILACGS